MLPVSLFPQGRDRSSVLPAPPSMPDTMLLLATEKGYEYQLEQEKIGSQLLQ
jgi:hypothetical protein